MVTRLTLAYDGSPFAGWAVQPGERTVCGELEAALADGAARAGRADRRGAHRPRRARARAGVLLRGRAAVAAVGQRGAAGRDRRAGRRGDARRLLRPPRRALARLRLPAARARGAVAVRARPRAVVAARARGGARCTPARRCWPARTTSRPSRPPTPTTSASSATCSGARWERAGDVLEFHIEADTFMRHMNRVLVGTMLEVAGGARSVEAFARAARGPPARGGGAHRAAARPLPGARHLLAQQALDLAAAKSLERLRVGGRRDRHRPRPRRCTRRGTPCGRR